MFPKVKISSWINLTIGSSWSFILQRWIGSGLMRGLYFPSTLEYASISIWWKSENFPGRLEKILTYHNVVTFDMWMSVDCLDCEMEVIIWLEVFNFSTHNKHLILDVAFNLCENWNRELMNNFVTSKTHVSIFRVNLHIPFFVQNLPVDRRWLKRSTFK